MKNDKQHISDLQKEIEALKKENQELKKCQSQVIELQSTVSSMKEHYEVANEELMAVNEEFEAQNIELLDSQEILQISENRFKQLFENITSGVVVYKAIDDGKDFIIIDVNYAVEKMEQITRDQCIGKKVTEVFPGVIDFGLLSVFTEVWHSGEPQHFPLSFYEDGRIKGWRDNYVYKISDDEIVAVYQDLTEKMIIQEEMSRLVDILETTPDLVATTTIDGDLTYLNKNGFKMAKLPYGDLQGMKNSDFHPQGDVDYIINVGIPEAIKHGSWTGETILLDSEGNEIPVSQVIMVHYNDDGSPKYFSTIIRDISAIKKVQRDLETTQAFLQAAIEQSPAGIVIAEPPDVNITMVNPAALGIKNNTDMQLKDIPLELHPINWQLCHLDGTVFEPEELPLSQAVLEEKVVPNVDMIIKTQDGDERWVIANASPIYNKEGELIAGIVIFPDITERKKQEHELNTIKNLLNNIINSMPSIIIGLDGDTKITQWNEKAEEIFNLKASDVTGKHLSIVENFYKSISDILLSYSDNKKIVEVNQRKFDFIGIEKYYDVALYPLGESESSGMVLRVDDVTQRVRMEEIMIQTEKMMSVGGLAAGMAHEINNPLAGILQGAQLLESRLFSSIEANQKAADQSNTNLSAIENYMELRNIKTTIDAIKISGNKAAKIVKNMLNFSRKSVSNNTKNSITHIMDNAIDLARSDYNLKKHYDFRHISIEKNYEENIPDILCDATNIEQVFLNILKNGAEAMGETSSERKPAFEISIQRSEDMIKIMIADNGPGMSEDISRHVLEPFFTTKPVGHGTGLGLSVSYFIIKENHNGKIHVESEENKGSTFIIELPCDSS